jgi:hypothetical protein
MRRLAMKRHLSFIAALGMCFVAPIIAAYAQVRADTGSIAIGGSVTGSTVRKRWMNLFRAGTRGARGALDVILVVAIFVRWWRV